MRRRYFHPRLVGVLSKFLLVFRSVGLRLYPIHLGQGRSSVSNAIGQRRSLGVKYSSGCALSQAVGDVCYVEVPVDLFLPTRGTLYFLGALKAYHYGRFERFGRPIATGLAVGFF